MSTTLHQLGSTALAQQAQPRLALLTLDQGAEMLGTSKAWVRDHATRRNPRIPCGNVMHEARNCPKRNEVAVNV